jgi:hypothetical protein
MTRFEKSRTIHDRLYGSVDLTKEEMAVIDHPLFQRLRRIRQTGMLFLVMPSSVHTRFEHSIGVLKMADELMLSVRGESIKIAAKLYAPEEAKPGQAVRFSDIDPDLRNQLRRAIRMCGLVHDLGHGPLSHTFEAFAPNSGDIERLLGDPRLAVLAPYTAALVKSKTGRVSHEAISAILFAVIWHDIGRAEQEMPRVVASVLLDAPPVGITADLVPWIPFMRDIVSSAPIDADRMDYLLRDSTAMGVTYGLYEKHRIMKSVLCVKSLDPDGGFRLGWRDSGLPAIENFVQARYQMFVQLYRHKTYRGIELSLNAIGEEARKNGMTVVDTTNLQSLTHSYTLLGDDYFISLLSGEIRKNFPKNDRIKALAQAIGERKLWKRILDFKSVWPENREGIISELKSAFPTAVFLIDRVPIQAMKDIDRGGYLLELDDEACYSCVSHEGIWRKASPIMTALYQMEQAVTRLYMETRGDSPKASLVRQEAIRLARKHK